MPRCQQKCRSDIGRENLPALACRLPQDCPQGGRVDAAGISSGPFVGLHIDMAIEIGRHWRHPFPSPPSIDSLDRSCYRCELILRPQSTDPRPTLTPLALLVFLQAL